MRQMISNLEDNLDGLSDDLKTRFKKLVISQLGLLRYRDNDFNIKAIQIAANTGNTHRYRAHRSSKKEFENERLPFQAGRPNTNRLPSERLTSRDVKDENRDSACQSSMAQNAYRSYTGDSSRRRRATLGDIKEDQLGVQSVDTISKTEGLKQRRATLGDIKMETTPVDLSSKALDVSRQKRAALGNNTKESTLKARSIDMSSKTGKLSNQRNEKLPVFDFKKESPPESRSIDISTQGGVVSKQRRATVGNIKTESTQEASPIGMSSKPRCFTKERRDDLGDIRMKNTLGSQSNDIPPHTRYVKESFANSDSFVNTPRIDVTHSKGQQGHMDTDPLNDKEFLDESHNSRRNSSYTGTKYVNVPYGGALSNRTACDQNVHRHSNKYTSSPTPTYDPSTNPSYNASSARSDRSQPTSRNDQSVCGKLRVERHGADTSYSSPFTSRGTTPTDNMGISTGDTRLRQTEPHYQRMATERVKENSSKDTLKPVHVSSPETFKKRSPIDVMISPRIKKIQDLLSDDKPIPATTKEYQDTKHDHDTVRKEILKQPSKGFAKLQNQLRSSRKWLESEMSPRQFDKSPASGTSESVMSQPVEARKYTRHEENRERVSTVGDDLRPFSNKGLVKNKESLNGETNTTRHIKSEPLDWLQQYGHKDAQSPVKNKQTNSKSEQLTSHFTPRRGYLDINREMRLLFSGINKVVQVIEDLMSKPEDVADFALWNDVHDELTTMGDDITRLLTKTRSDVVKSEVLRTEYEVKHELRRWARTDRYNMASIDELIIKLKKTAEEYGAIQTNETSLIEIGQLLTRLHSLSCSLLVSLRRCRNDSSKDDVCGVRKPGGIVQDFMGKKIDVGGGSTLSNRTSVGIRTSPSEQPARIQHSPRALTTGNQRRPRDLSPRNQLTPHDFSPRTQPTPRELYSGTQSIPRDLSPRNNHSPYNLSQRNQPTPLEQPVGYQPTPRDQSVGYQPTPLEHPVGDQPIPHDQSPRHQHSPYNQSHRNQPTPREQSFRNRPKRNESEQATTNNCSFYGRVLVVFMVGFLLGIFSGLFGPCVLSNVCKAWLSFCTHVVCNVRLNHCSSTPVL